MRQHQVEYQKVWRLCRNRVERIASRADAVGRKPCLREIPVDQFRDVRVVLHNQDARRHAGHSTGDDCS
jgi:hypothetical protein